MLFSDLLIVHCFVEFRVLLNQSVLDGCPCEDCGDPGIDNVEHVLLVLNDLEVQKGSIFSEEFLDSSNFFGGYRLPIELR